MGLEAGNINCLKSKGGTPWAKMDSWFSHTAMEVLGEESGNEWCKPVTDEF